MKGKHPVASEKKPRILVVDDDEELCEMIYGFLTYKGFYVKTAFDGVAGCEALKEGSFDMLITDIYMPRMNGLELLDAIEHKYSDLLVLAMTGFPNPDLSKKIIKKGACDCLTKPFPMKFLITAIKKCFEQSGSHKLLAESISNN